MSGRRILGTVGSVALGLAVLLSAQPAPAAHATDYRTVSVASQEFSKSGLAEKTCLLQAERSIAAHGMIVWDPANDGDRTVQGKGVGARVQVFCAQQGQGTVGVVSAYADDPAAAKRLRDEVRAYILGQPGPALFD